MSHTQMTPDTLRAQAHVMKEDFPVISDGAIEGLMMIADTWQAQIAAATDLLAVLRPIERQMDGETMFPGPVYLSASEANAIVEAIAKATP